MELQKRAIIGYEKETAFFRDKIRQLVALYGAEQVAYPSWFESLDEAIFAENWGFSGIAEWFHEAYRNCSSAKVIGDRIYFLQDGCMRLMPQTISKERREQLVRAFLLQTPEERLDKEFHEVYLLDGTRVTIFRGAMTKRDQEVIIFRRYVVPEFRFEEQAARGTIPKTAIPLFETMVKLGFNVVFLGQIRSAKTTFLSTWQSYEDPSLEGVLVETDPEIPLHRLMPQAPILQLLADQERLGRISKNLLRSDADYFILAEARDGLALDTAVRLAAKGTKRMKMTFHSSDPLDFTTDVAWEIVRSLGGDLAFTAKKVAASFDYLFHFVQLPSKNQKRLKGIYELRYDRATASVQTTQICRYQTQTDSWEFTDHMSDDKWERALEESPAFAARFREQLKALASAMPMQREGGSF